MCKQYCQLPQLSYLQPAVGLLRLADSPSSHSPAWYGGSEPDGSCLPYLPSVYLLQTSFWSFLHLIPYPHLVVLLFLPHPFPHALILGSSLNHSSWNVLQMHQLRSPQLPPSVLPPVIHPVLPVRLPFQRPVPYRLFQRHLLLYLLNPDLRNHMHQRTSHHFPVCSHHMYPVENPAYPGLHRPGRCSIYPLGSISWHMWAHCLLLSPAFHGYRWRGL